jgi:hypothetical protein
MNAGEIVDVFLQIPTAADAERRQPPHKRRRGIGRGRIMGVIHTQEFQYIGEMIDGTHEMTAARVIGE